MPSVSAKQHRFMEMVAHNPAAAKRVGVPQSVGEDYVQADKGTGKKFAGPKKPRRPKEPLSAAIHSAMSSHGMETPE